MFKETLKQLVDTTDGALGALVMDREGIAVERYARESGGFDVDAVAVEMGVVLNQARRAVESLEAGVTTELVIATDKLVAVIRPLGEGYYMALALKPEGSAAKGRYLMRLAAPKLLAELA